MSIFRCQVFYQRGTAEKWTNVYHLSDDDLIVARDNFATVAVPILLGLLDPSCSILKILVSAVVGDDFSEIIFNEPGTHFGSGTLLPLFNSIKIFFQPSTLGRQDYKFLKGLVGEDNSDSDGLEATARATVDSEFTAMITDMLTAGTALVSENGDVWEDVSVQQPIQMRQLHRRRRRSVAP